jgi:hypothetical protein
VAARVRMLGSPGQALTADTASSRNPEWRFGSSKYRENRSIHRP